MPLNPKLQAKLSKTFPADARIEDTFSGKDLTILTDSAGRAITLFIGKSNPDGSIKGERFVRRFTLQPDGVTLKTSHWEAKGNVTRS